jgi:hypothetical protein
MQWFVRAAFGLLNNPTRPAAVSGRKEERFWTARIGKLDVAYSVGE